MNCKAPLEFGNETTILVAYLISSSPLYCAIRDILVVFHVLIFIIVAFVVVVVIIIIAIISLP